MIFSTLKKHGSGFALRLVYDKLFRRRLYNFNRLSFLFGNKVGIEIGGPSLFFSNRGFIPLYSLARKIDGCNFSFQTTWEGNINEGETFLYAPGKLGHQFICEGAEVIPIPKHHYDFVLSCNNLEHIANPLKAIENWLHLLKDDAVIVLVLPRKESNFDHRRQVTSFDHLLLDYKINIGEDDLTHIDEVIKLHDLELDPPAGNPEDFKQRSLNNYSNRCLHHHVFDLNLLKEICNFFKLTPLVTKARAIDYVIIAQKSAGNN